MRTGIQISLFSAVMTARAFVSAECPAIFQQPIKALNNEASIDLCAVTAGKPVLLVNTASRGGFVEQLAELEAIHERYKDHGLVVIGVSSDSFDGKADENAAADIYFHNYGVTFTMAGNVDVAGDNAHPLYQEVARQYYAPKWSFYKYLVTAEGQVVATNSSFTMPTTETLDALIRGELQAPLQIGYLSAR
jgi:glutathione peroxidase